MTVTIKGKTYSVEVDSQDLPRLAASLKAGGFDGHVYYLTGKRGAVKMAYRSATTGEFKIV